MKKIIKDASAILVSLIGNSAIIYCTYQATFNANENFGNVVKFLAAVTIVISPVVLFLSVFGGYGEKGIPRTRKWFSHITDASTVAMLVWHGWIWCALAFLLGWILCAMAFEVSDLRKSSTK